MSNLRLHAPFSPRPHSVDAPPARAVPTSHGPESPDPIPGPPAPRVRIRAAHMWTGKRLIALSVWLAKRGAGVIARGGYTPRKKVHTVIDSLIAFLACVIITISLIAWFDVVMAR
ncbi:MAG TPA: hypothetical protein VFB43_17840 [Terracidiphilus sp.]|nr:hypothetical protein [Terracidiphilus sp.]